VMVAKKQRANSWEIDCRRLIRAPGNTQVTFRNCGFPESIQQVS
jgi:hypothetical protein